jgi:uncharacterized protein YdaU (DUF1376 family)
MAREKTPAFQFYPKDWLSDDKVQLMTPSERGVYITLLCHNWLEGSLPEDPRALAQLASCRKGWFYKMWNRAIGKCFTSSSLGRLVNPRLEREREKQALFRGLRAEAGRRGGQVRQANAKQTSSKRQANGQAKSSSSSSTPVLTPYSPPLKGGRPLTRDEKQHAERVLKNRFGRCHHHPRCPDHAACVERLVAELREKRKASR